MQRRRTERGRKVARTVWDLVFGQVGGGRAGDVVEWQ